MLSLLKFTPSIHTKVWGYESWLLSGYGDHVSVVENGDLKGNDLNDLLETYMDELVGGKVYDCFGNYFPLLIKVIKANDDLSIQVHPDDETAADLDQLGKTEMWYVMDADKDAHVVSGFVKQTSAEEVRRSLQDNTLTDFLQYTDVEKGDVVWIPAGRVHALCKGTMVAEIQESSDITYRLYDYNRPDKDGNLRPLHIEEALAVLDYDSVNNPVAKPVCRPNASTNLVRDVHFTTNLLRFSQTIERDYAPLDSFVVYVCVEGEADILALDAEEKSTVHIQCGETVLVPVSFDDIRLVPTTSDVRIVETYID